VSEPTGAGWVYGCAVCRDRPETQAICPCKVCGSDHSLCFPCLTAMCDLGAVKYEIRHEKSHLPSGIATMRSTQHRLKKCPSEAGVRAAVLLARK